MSILVKGNITITKGFDTWKKMVHEQDDKLERAWNKIYFCGNGKK
jgi:hypothetical protein